MASEKEAKDELYQRLKDGITNVLKEENFKNWLNTSGSYFTHYYSMNNALLIFAQNPNATYVKGYEQWKDFGRQVNKGEKGMQVILPVKAYEKRQGDFLRYVKDSLNRQLDNNTSEEVVYHNLDISGTTKVSLNRNVPGKYGLVINGKDRGIFTEEQLGKFIRDHVLNKLVQRYSVGTVFDIKQCSTPEYLWLKQGNFKKEELALNEQGEPVQSKRGEFRVKNSEDRIKKFNPELDMHVEPIDEKKADVLLKALKTVSSQNGIPIYEVDRESDDTLKGGADGYFSRAEGEKNTKGKGFIVLPKDLENKTKLVSVLMHEMAHSDLHGSLEKAKLYDRSTRELQAEATAYSVASQFGVQTDTSSFQYLAAWQKGLDFKDLRKNLEVIYKECQAMTKEIAAELDKLGYSLDLTEKQTAMTRDSLEEIAAGYVEKTVPIQKSVDEIKYELPNMLNDNKGNPELVTIIKEQAKLVNAQQMDLDAVYNSVSDLKKSVERGNQDAIIEKLDSAVMRLNENSLRIEELSNQFIDVAAKKQANKFEEFKQKPMTVLRELAKSNTDLKDLSKMQLSYIAKSKYISNEYGKLLNTNPEEFAKKAAARALKIDGVISKSNQFIEINYCEQWFNNPIFEGGQMMHPKNAETISKQAEKQIAAMQRKTEDYIPYSKCSFTVFDASGNNLTALTDRMDIGDGYQSSLSDFLSKQASSKTKSINEGLSKALKEKSVKDKIYSEPKQDIIEKTAELTKEDVLENQQTIGAWKADIAEERAKQEVEQSQDNDERGKDEVEKEDKSEHSIGGK